MKIGLTIADLKNYKNKIYSSGIDQHIMFFYKYLNKKTNADVYLLSNNNDNFEKFLDINNIKSYKDIDIVILIGLTIHNSINRFCKNNNVKIISYRLGHSFITDLNGMLEKSNSGLLRDIKDNDEVWISPHFAYTQDYYKYIYRTNNVLISPYFWDSSNLKNNILKPLDKLNIAICESNLLYNKSCFVPIMICDRAKDYINHVNVYGAKRLEKNPSFNKFLKKSDLFSQNKLSIKYRMMFYYIIEKECNVVVSFTDDCDLNFLSLECFYKGIPLIHNSKMLKDWGFYYPKCNVGVAAEHLKRLSLGLFNREYYIERHKPLLKKYSMENQDNIDFFNNRLNIKSI